MNKMKDEINKSEQSDDDTIIVTFACVGKAPIFSIPMIISSIKARPDTKIIYKRVSAGHLVIMETDGDGNE